VNKTLSSAFLSLLLLSTLLLTLLAVPAHAELSWNVQIVDEDASGIGYGFCPIVVGADDNPHIAYSGHPYARYASWNGSDWNIQQLSSTAFVHDLALDANGNPHITLGSSYATWNGTGWDTQTFTSDGGVFSSLAFDSSGNPHISSRVFLSGQMLYPGYTSTIMYATANITEPAEVSPTFPLLIVSAAIIIGTVIAVIAYVWKKKTKH
jgi:hypothetical protein